MAVLAGVATLVTAAGTARADTPHTDRPGMIVAPARSRVTDLTGSACRLDPDPPVVRRPDMRGSATCG